MIKADKAYKNPSEYILRRSAKMRAALLKQIYEGERVTEIRIEPDESGKSVRIASFHERGGDVYIACFDEQTLVACPANRFNRMCSHVNAAINFLLSTEPKENR